MLTDLVVWFGLGILGYSMLFAYFQRRFKLIASEDYHSTLLFCLGVSLISPLSAIICTVYYSLRDGWYGFKLW